MIEDICSDQKSQTIKCEIAKLLNDLCENVDGLFQFILSFALDKIDKALVDHIPTRLSFTANVEEGENTSITEMEESKTEKKYPETLFTNPELCQIIRHFNLKFNSVQEWIEVCLVTITITSWLLPSNKDSAMMLD